MTFGQRIVLKAQTLLGVIDNGGLEYYLSNRSSDDLAGDLSALRSLRATKYVELIEEGLALFPGIRTADLNRRVRMIEKRSKKVDEALKLVNQFFYLEHGTSRALFWTLVLYVLRNPGDFFLPAKRKR